MARSTLPPRAEAPADKVRAVAFAIAGQVYAGRGTESHTMLYLRLLRDNLMPATTLDAWTSEESSHGFVTEQGKFLDRPAAFARFGTTRSEDLKAGGQAPTPREGESP